MNKHMIKNNILGLTISALLLMFLQSTNAFPLISTGPLSTAREQHTATLLPNGQVLVAGGADSSGNPSSVAELYNPANGTWTTTNSLNTAREWHTATLLLNGEVLVAGGQGTAPGALASAELYNPTTGTWTPTGSMNTGREWHTATLLANGKVLVAGGYG
ncbi:MAG: kelch repeat-containing protein, partial [Verrucomicrobiota bacterium]